MSVKYIGHIINEPGPHGTIDIDRIITSIDEHGDTHQLDLRLDLANHSPTGFCWGYSGSGPAQTALAILADYLQDNMVALYFYQDFKNKVIAGFPMDADFELTSERIDETIMELRANIRKERAIR